MRACITGGPARATPFRPSGTRSDGVDLVSLRTLCALAGVELDPLVLLEAAETASLDGGVMNEDIRSAVVGGDETIAPVGVEPLHCSLSHCAFSYTSFSRPGQTPGPGGVYQAPAW